MNSFQALIESIADSLGPTSGLDSDDVNVDHLLSIMQSYISDEFDWHSYALSDASRNYTRNQVDDTNGKSNVLVVVWVNSTFVTFKNLKILTVSRILAKDHLYMITPMRTA